MLLSCDYPPVAQAIPVLITYHKISTIINLICGEVKLITA